MRIARRFLFALGTTLCVIVIACIAAVGYFSHWRQADLLLDSSVSLMVEPGETYLEIAATLEEKGLIQNQRLFLLLGWLEGKVESLQAGEYIFEASASPDSIIQALTTGDVVEYQVMLPEGSTFAGIKRVLEGSEHIVFDLDEVTVHDVLAHLSMGDEDSTIESTHGEGWFFPDTYTYRRGDSASDILRSAFEKMDQELSAAWRSSNKPEVITNRYELLILASIVEKETSMKSDRLRVSGVFCRRLEKRMRLQADPTVIYGLGDAFTGNLTRKHLQTDNEYNTYTRFGLPPTPISSPSANALYAAANPAKGDELYFVGRGDGSTQFSVTLQEHNEAVRRFQLKKRD